MAKRSPLWRGRKKILVGYNLEEARAELLEMVGHLINGYFPEMSMTEDEWYAFIEAANGRIIEILQAHSFRREGDLV